MARPVKRHLKIGATPHLDEGELFVRMHKDDVPKDMKWGNYIRLSANKSSITCKVLSNAMAEIKPPRAHQISINKHLKDILGVKPGTTANFYISKASSVKAPFYIMRYHPNKAVRRKVFWKTSGVIVVAIIVIVLVALYFQLWR